MARRSRGTDPAQRHAIALGRRISEARKARRWTQEELGTRAGGYGRPAINLLEHGRRPNPTAALVYGVAMALGLTFEDLWLGGPHPEANVSPEDKFDTVARYVEDLRGDWRSQSGSSTAIPEDKGRRGRRRSRR